MNQKHLSLFAILSTLVVIGVTEGATAKVSSGRSFQHGLTWSANEKTPSPKPRSNPEEPVPPFVDPTIPKRERCTIPNVMGLNFFTPEGFSKVVQLVEEGNCIPGGNLNFVETSAVPEGTIIGHSPSPGTVMRRSDSFLDLTIAVGPLPEDWK